MIGSRTLSAILAVTFFAAVSPAFSQTTPAAYQSGGAPFTIGVGASNLNVDWGTNRMYGISAWAEWRPGLLPRFLEGLGLEAEGRDIDYGRPSALPPNFRIDTGGGGPMYTYRRFRKIQPYAKFLVEFGSLDANSHSIYAHHFTRTVYAPGGGIQYRLVRHLWARADYEYQMWPHLFAKTFDPQGFTAGFSYDLGFHSR